MSIRVLGPSFFATPVSTGAGGFSHNFTLLSNGNPLSGVSGGWSNTANVTADDNVGTYTRGMQYSGTGYNTAYRNSSLANGTYAMRLHASTGSIYYAALFARMTAGGLGGVILMAHSGSGTWKIQIYDNTSTLQLDYDTTVAWADNTTYDMSLVLSGSSVIGKIGGVQVGATQTDSWQTSYTYVGFGYNGNGTTGVALIENISAA